MSGYDIVETNRNIRDKRRYVIECPDGTERLINCDHDTAKWLDELLNKWESWLENRRRAGRLSGRVRSEKKAASSRANGAKGGRPRKADGVSANERAFGGGYD